MPHSRHSQPVRSPGPCRIAIGGAPQLRATILICLVLATAGSAMAAASRYHVVATIPVGGDGWWDYLSVDAAAHRLYVSHASKVVVIDTRTDTVVGEIADTQGVHGLAVAQELGLGFTSNGQTSTSSIIDLETLATVGAVPTGANPDAILYVPGRQEVYTFNGRGRSATVFAARTGEVVTTIELPGKPEFAVLDAAAGRIYDNIEDTNEVVAIDIATHRVVARWPIAPGEAASGLAIDEEHHRLFLGCDNRLMVMMDSRDGRVVATVPIGDGVDGCAFDPATQLAFASCGSGTLTIAHEDTPDRLTVVQTVTTARSARTMALDPATHRVYLSAADLEPPPRTAPAGHRQRPTIVPGSFRVLVLAPDGE